MESTSLSTSVKNQALLAMADSLEERSAELVAANEQDLDAFDVTPEKKAMADRLRLTPARISEMAAGIREVAKLPDFVYLDDLGMLVPRHGNFCASTVWPGCGGVGKNCDAGTDPAAALSLSHAHDGVSGDRKLAA